ncbi:MAG: PRC-barrel domain-containing protein [bacterium]
MRHLLFAATMLSTLSLASAAMAQGVGVGVGGAAGAGTGGGAGVGAGATSAVGSGADGTAGLSGGTSADGTAEAGASEQALGSVDEQLVIGASVVSSDGIRIGTVDDIELDADRLVVITVGLEDELGMSRDSIRIRSHSATFVHSEVRLDVTKRDFVTSLEAHLGADADGG